MARKGDPHSTAKRHSPSLSDSGSVLDLTLCNVKDGDFRFSFAQTEWQGLQLVAGKAGRKMMLRHFKAVCRDGDNMWTNF